MMKAKNRFATLVMTGLLVVSSQAVLAQGKDMALFLLIGQSNMAGRGTDQRERPACREKCLDAQ